MSELVCVWHNEKEMSAGEKERECSFHPTLTHALRQHTLVMTALGEKRTHVRSSLKAFFDESQQKSFGELQSSDEKLTIKAC